MDNNLCLYCGKEGHVVKDCKAAPKRNFVRKMDTVAEEDKGDDNYPVVDDTAISQINNAPDTQFPVDMGSEYKEYALLQTF